MRYLVVVALILSIVTGLAMMARNAVQARDARLLTSTVTKYQTQIESERTACTAEKAAITETLRNDRQTKKAAADEAEKSLTHPDDMCALARLCLRSASCRDHAKARAAIENCR